MPSFNSINVQQLARLIGTPQCPTIVDICIEPDFELDPRLIPTAVRHPFTKIRDLVPSLRGKKVVVVCQKGLKLSQGASAILRAEGIECEGLEGGNFAWRDAGETLIPAAKLPHGGANIPSLWVTRQRPKIDRIACPWLIRRFIDPRAQFLFVSASEVRHVAEKYDAIPFDVEDVHFSHRGDLCTFDVMLQEFELTSAPLAQLGLVVRGADTNRHDLAPESAGLLALSVGLSRMFRNDLEQLDAGILVYDALYRWARDGMDEQHDWK
ncbi:MAG: chromate resistance protein [Ahrensia sp.]|nr:chromate resistance protein [Ahrensia sp.]